jgi:hypothetical protein
MSFSTESQDRTTAYRLRGQMVASFEDKLRDYRRESRSVMEVVTFMFNLVNTKRAVLFQKPPLPNDDPVFIAYDRAQVEATATAAYEAAFARNCVELVLDI